MGCPNFFKYHKNATVDDYAERFGYNAQSLKEAIKSSGMLDKYQPESNTSMVNALIEMDNMKLTKNLYESVNKQNYLAHQVENDAPISAGHEAIQTPINYFSSTSPDKMAEYNTVAEESGETIDEEKEYIASMPEDDEKKKTKLKIKNAARNKKSHEKTRKKKMEPVKHQINQ